MPSSRALAILSSALFLAGLACSLPDLSRWLSGSGQVEPTPTSRPLEAVPPRLVESRPSPGEELLPDEPVLLYFDQPMVPESVERAIVFQPSVDGEFLWLDAATLQFQPDPGWQRGTSYVLSLDSSAASAEGLGLSEPVRLSLPVSGPLQVIQVLPQAGALDVQPDTVITVVFNHPVVALQLDGQLPQPVSVDPAADGQGEWLDTNIYLFRPSPALPGGVPVTVRVAETLTDLTGAGLAQPYSWSFTTALPRVVEVQPAPGSVAVAPDSAVIVRFDQPMDPGSVQQAFRLLGPSGRPVDGLFAWDDRFTEINFRPAERLAYGADFQVQVTDRARSGSGAALLNEHNSTFQVVPRPAVLTTEPLGGSQVSPYTPIQITFSAPMDPASVLNALRLTPAVENLGTSWDTDGLTLYVHGDLEPSTRYDLTLAATAADPFGTPLARLYSLTFTTDALPHQVGFSRYTPALTLLPDRAPQVEVMARNLSRLDLSLYRIDLPAFLEFLRRGSHLSDPPRPATGLLREWTEPVEAPADVMETLGIVLQTNPLPAGCYLLTLDAPSDASPAQGRLLLVRPTELVLKQSPDGSLVWAVDLETGRPLAGLRLRLIDENGIELAAGSTDQDGVWQAGRVLPATDNPWASVIAVSGSPGDPNFGLTSSAWSYGISPYDFGLALDPAAPTLTAYLYTERPIYRPGQTVFYRGVLRLPTDTGLALPDLASLALTVHSPTGEVVVQQRPTLSRFGTFNGQIDLGESAPLGSYWIETEYGSVVFEVAEYRRPEYLVELEPQSTQLAGGDRLTAGVTASYTFGGPVAEAPVTWVAWAEPTSLPDLPLPIDWFASTEMELDPFARETLAAGEGFTGPDGKFRVSFQTPAGAGRPRRVTLEATVTDAAGLPVTSRTEVILHPASHYLTLAPQEYVIQSGEEAAVLVQALDWHSEPLAGVEADVSVERLTWQQSVGADGSLVWTAQAELLNRGAVVSEADGVARVSFRPPQAGTYRLQARGQDAAGRQVIGTVIVYAAGPGEPVWRQAASGRLTLVPDRTTYQPGQTARLLVPTPFDGPTAALLTVEREGVFHHSVRQISRSNSVLEVPIEAGYEPNVFVSVVLIDTGQAGGGVPVVTTGTVELPVDAGEHQLQISLTTDPAAAGPGDEVSTTVRARDASGRPVEAELSLALVDVATLALLPPNSPPPFDALYAARPLRVQTGASLTISGMGVLLVPAGGGLGGGGDRGPTAVRTEFPDTAYWRADLVTDQQGRATVSLRLPDSLTTWRMEARGVTRDTSVGSTTLDLLATKDLLIRPVTPRFFTAGDRAQVAAVVHNNTPDPITAEVWLEAEGAVVTEAARQTVELPAMSLGRAEWEIGVQDESHVGLVFHVAGGGRQDASVPTVGSAVDGALPVLRYSAPGTAATAGWLNEAGRSLEVISLPRRYDATQGELRVTIDPSLGSAVVSALEALELRTYASNEQTASHLLAELAALQVLESTGFEEPALRTRLERVIPAAIELLSGRQSVDGGWGWWPESPSQSYLTAVVAHSLGAAQAAGFSVQPDTLDRAAGRLRAELLPADRLVSSEDIDRQAMLLLALAVTERGDPQATRSLAGLTGRLSNTAAALVLRSLSLLDPLDDSIPRLASELNAAAVTSASGTHWEDPASDRSSMPSAVRTTAQVVQALLATDPDQALIPNAIRWLLSTRRPEGDWPSSHEAGWATLAVAEWIESAGTGDAAFDYTADLNGLPLVTGQAVPGQLAPGPVLTTPISSLLAGEPNRLVLGRGPGPGALAYTAHLTVYRPVEEIEPTERGLAVSREYFRYDGECGGVDDPCPIADQVLAGEDLLVRLTLRVPSQQYYVVVEDPLPAGAEPIDPTLATSPSQTPDEAWSMDDLLRSPWGWWSFTRAEVGDDQIRLFADFLAPGTYQYTYRLHAAFAGEFRVLPTRAYAVYQPEVYGQAAGRVFSILAAP